MRTTRLSPSILPFGTLGLLFMSVHSLMYGYIVNASNSDSRLMNPPTNVSSWA